MAVQAQYPSNVLLLNRNVQERKDMLGGDFSLQAQVGGFLDQSQMFSNGGSNPRKRGRENVPVSLAPINLSSLQSQPPSPNLVNLSQLQNQQPSVVSTGLRLAFEEQKQKQQNQNQSLLLLQSDDLSIQIKQQRDEIDQFIQAQGDQLRRTLAEKRQRHYRTLLGVAEESASRRLREKESEVEKAARRKAELEERLARLQAESQVWQAKARAQEAEAVSLQVQLQQAMNGAALNTRGEPSELPADDAESAYIDPGRNVSGGPICKACRKRPVSVVLLPCRHFCLCIDCDSAVGNCPLCHSVRSASVEVYLS
ncbi:putative BOI-related E3 ubiquitin-protein ligase 3 [Tasmannia lanceolata]|uniref:putative BOI-related E3 ubiquitin-protein ligase 3 n=1 Tax=Tasmannia lanceolata TaxID=3420 RepID=UPI0040647557